MTGDLLAWQGVFMFVAVAIAATTLLVVHMRHRHKLALARATADRDEAYRELAATSVAEVARMADEVAALRNAVGEVQRLLREIG
ncbi:MAG TPA: hypothetical protein VFC19_21400 [Candidatus Limnocylindrales bacterium]|nr:hypothetical protein [Candidatus Limnocylindrales bacterium]